MLRVAQTASGHSVIIKDSAPSTLAHNRVNQADNQTMLKAAKQLAREQYHNVIANGNDSNNPFSSAKAFEKKFSSLLEEQGRKGSVLKTNLDSSSLKYQRYLAKKFSVLNALEATYAIGLKVNLNLPIDATIKCFSYVSRLLNTSRRKMF